MIIVTGASRGLGQFIRANYIARDGLCVGISRTGPYRCDVTNEADVETCLKDLSELKYDINGLVLAHGIAAMNHFLFTPIEKVRQIFETNVISTFSLIQKFGRLMRGKNNASIVCFSSIAVPFSLEGEAAYVASKAALEALVKVGARELAPLGIRVNAVGPGPVNTDLIRNVPEEKINQITRRQAQKKMTEKIDVFNVVDFLLSEKSSSITGQTLYLGGL